MGGRGTTGKTKLFTNIDAARNIPLREARTKEIEAERVVKEITPITKKSSGTKKIIEKKDIVTIATRDGKRENVESLARSNDGLLHINKTGKYSFSVTNSKSGESIQTFSSKKSALRFLNAATNAEGKASPTLRRFSEYFSYSNKDFKNLPAERRKALSRSFQAVMKMKERIGYD